MLAGVLTLSACASASGDSPTVAGAAAVASTTITTTTVAPPTTTSATAAPTTTTTLSPAPAPATTAAPRNDPRTVVETGYSPYATIGELVLLHPSSRVERVAFHQSNHDGAHEQSGVPTTANSTTLDDRERGTGRHTAADIVSDPEAEIRSPVTGTVIRGGSYTLYCDYRDHYVVIEPDAHPGWEVKVLHMDGLFVARGDRVVAGETVLAPHARILPFESQVDEIRTTDPAWPHVHIEVVDPTIPDRPGEGCP